MDCSGAQHTPRTVDEVFRDFMGRRTAVIKALTTSLSLFQTLDVECILKNFTCNVILKWRVFVCTGFPLKVGKLPAEEVPANLPEPTLGINFARDSLQEKDQLSLVTFSGFLFRGKVRFDKAGRERLFTLINDLPTIFEVLTGTAEEQADKKLSVLNLNSSKSKSGSEGGSESGEDSEEAKDEDEGLYEEDSEDYRDPLCGIHGEDDGSTPDDELFCDTCEKYYHFKCVNSENHSCKGRTHKASISAPHAAISP